MFKQNLENIYNLMSVYVKFTRVPLNYLGKHV